MRKRVKRGEEVHLKEPVQPPPSVPTFAQAGAACHQAKRQGWRNKRHRDTWIASLENHIHPRLGSVPVDEVTPTMVRDAIAPIWLTIPETARRILHRIGTVLDYAHISGRSPHEASLRTVPKGLPQQPQVESHFVAMPYEEVPAFLEQLREPPHSANRNALLFTILNAVRSGETRLGTWPEIDLDAAVWSIPGAPHEDAETACGAAREAGRGAAPQTMDSPRPR
jgi:integrase